MAESFFIISGTSMESLGVVFIIITIIIIIIIIVIIIIMMIIIMFNISIVQISMWIWSNVLYNSRGNQINIAQITILQLLFHKSNQVKSNRMLVFDEKGKLEYPGKNLSEKSREPTNSIHIWRRVRKSNSGHIGGSQVLSPLGQACHQISFNSVNDMMQCKNWALSLG